VYGNRNVVETAVFEAGVVEQYLEPSALEELLNEQP
jgi:hypothetical protein